MFLKSKNMKNVRTLTTWLPRPDIVTNNHKHHFNVSVYLNKILLKKIKSQTPVNPVKHTLQYLLYIAPPYGPCLLPRGISMHTFSPLRRYIHVFQGVGKDDFENILAIFRAPLGQLTMY